MYKPHTIEQYRIQQLLGVDFAMERFLIDLLSQMSLFLKIKTGEQIAFGFWDNKVQEKLRPTVSLNVENETKVQEALSRLLTGKTVLVSAHRMRTVAETGHTRVMKEG